MCFAQEGILVMIADDRFRNHTIDLEKIFDDSSATCHGGVMHVLHSHGAKAKRVPYSTSHSETLAMVNGIESTTLVSTRLSELMHFSPSPTLANLVSLQENGNPVLPADYYSDCADLWELSTGQRTLPQDESQRLYILGIRETRISGRMRLMTLVPTQSMVADALIKPMVSRQPLGLLSCGKVAFYNEKDNPIKSYGANRG